MKYTRNTYSVNTHEIDVCVVSTRRAKSEERRKTSGINGKADSAEPLACLIPPNIVHQCCRRQQRCYSISLQSMMYVRLIIGAR